MKAIALGLILAGYTVVVFGWDVVHGGGHTFREIIWPGAYGASSSAPVQPKAA